ncbi:hypothetical protein ACFOWM_13910, partial [Ferruginibacter yonginensis]
YPSVSCHYMKTPFIITISFLTFFASCDTSKKKKVDIKTLSHNDTLQPYRSNTKNQLQETLKTITKNIKPIFGYRFIISGDFDGDGKKEKLVEHYYSALDNKETNKFYDSLSEYEQLVELTIKKKPFSFVLSDNIIIDTLHISFGGQLLGLAYLKNEGDLNGDGTDEVSYVVNWADWSNLNTWHLVTYKNRMWTELYSFPIWDWQLPNLPKTFNQIELFELEQKIINTTNDTINKKIEKELSNFKGLVKKIKRSKIQVIFRNDEAEEDTMIVDLKQHL